MRLNSCCRLIGTCGCDWDCCCDCCCCCCCCDDDGGGGGGVEEQRGNGNGGGTSLRDEGQGEGEYWPVDARPLGAYGVCECGESERELPAPESRAGLPRWYCREGISRSMLGLRMSLGPRAGGCCLAVCEIRVR